jgi:hypothetical protein
MLRVIRYGIMASALFLLLTAAPPAHAVDSVSFTWTLDCSDENGVGSEEFGINLVPGTYAVTVTGACSVGTEFDYDVTASTPCTLPLVGGVPCVTPTVSGIPGAACYTSTGTLQLQTCEGPLPTTNGCPGLYTVTVNGFCPSSVPGAVGFFTHSSYTPSPMRAAFNDVAGWYWDNVGVFVVTATRI